jgi:hypothetical protein
MSTMTLAGRSPVSLSVCLEAEDVREDLALVVAGAARGDDAVLDAGVEGRALPEVERVDGLDVVVAVDEDGRAASFFGPCATTTGWPGVWCSCGVETDGLELGHEPVGAGVDLVLVLESVEMLPKRRKSRYWLSAASVDISYFEGSASVSRIAHFGGSGPRLRIGCRRR